MYVYIFCICEFLLHGLPTISKCWSRRDRFSLTDKPRIVCLVFIHFVYVFNLFVISLTKTI